MLPPNLYARVRTFSLHCTRDRGCGAHPVFPAASRLEGGRFQVSLGQNMSREREVILAVIARLDRATQYAETSVIEPRSRGVLDPPPARRMTVVCVALFPRHSRAREARATVRNCAPENPSNRIAGGAMDSGPAPKGAHPGMTSVQAKMLGCARMTLPAPAPYPFGGFSLRNRSRSGSTEYGVGIGSP